MEQVVTTNLLLTSSVLVIRACSKLLCSFMDRFTNLIRCLDLIGYQAEEVSTSDGNRNNWYHIMLPIITAPDHEYSKRISILYPNRYGIETKQSPKNETNIIL